MMMADTTARIGALEAEIDALHKTLEAKGTNSRRIKALDGSVFTLPVDREHKATQLPIFNCSNPHMRAFHASWFGFFATFFSTFAAAPLAPTLKQENTLGLTRNQLSLGGTLAVTSNIICRFLSARARVEPGALRNCAHRVRQDGCPSW